MLRAMRYRYSSGWGFALVMAFGCGPSGGGASSSAAASGAPASSAAKSTSSAASSASAAAAGSAAASAAPAAAPPKPEAFGPNVTKEVVESVNASNGFDTNQPAFSIDGKPATSWSSPPEGAWIEYALYPGTRVDGIELAGQRTGKTSNGEERWDINGVIKQLKVEWDGGQGELSFDRASDKGVRKKLPIGATTRKLRLSVVAFDKGAKSADIDIDELNIFGAAGSLKAPDKTGLTSLCKAESVAVRFKDGAVYGGEWLPPRDSAERAIHWDFTPTKSRVDDGEWHTLGLKYVEDSTVLPDGTKAYASDLKAVGKIARYRVAGDTFEGELDGKKFAGKCGVTMTGQ
jgi:hypothetical protein